MVESKYLFLEITKDNDIVYYNGKNIGIIDKSTGKEVAVFEYTKPSIIDSSSGIKVDHSIYFVNENNITNKVLEFSEGLAITYKQVNHITLFGFMDKKFKIVIEPKYDWVEPFKNGYALVRIKDKWGAINKSGKSILPIKYEAIKIIDSNRFLVLKGGEYGIINEAKRNLLPMIYSSVEVVNNNRFIVSKNGIYGVLDNQNNIILPLNYKKIFYLYDNLYAVGNGKKLGVVDENKKNILDYEYDGITSGLALKYVSSFNYPTSVPRVVLYFKGYYFDEKGLLDKENIGISKHIEGAYAFSVNPETFVPYDFSRNPETYIPYEIERDNKNKTQKYEYEEVIDNQFKIVGNKITEEPKILGTTQYGRIPYYLKGIINAKEEVIIPLIYEDVTQHNSSNIFIVKKDKKYGVINIENEFIINPEYDDIDIIGGAIVVLNVIEPNRRFERAVFDFTGKMIIPFKDVKYREGQAGSLITDNNIIDKRKL